MTEIMHPALEATVFGKRLMDMQGTHIPSIYVLPDYKAMDWSNPDMLLRLDRIDLDDCIEFVGDQVRWNTTAYSGWGGRSDFIDCFRHRDVHGTLVKINVLIDVDDNPSDIDLSAPLAWTQQKHNEVCAGYFPTLVKVSDINVRERLENMESFKIAADYAQEVNEWLSSDPVIQSADYGDIRLSLALNRRAAEKWHTAHNVARAAIEARAADPGFRGAKTRLNRALKLFRTEVEGKETCKTSHWDDNVREVKVWFYHRDDNSDSRSTTKITFRCHMEGMSCARITMSLNGNQLVQSAMAEYMGDRFSEAECKRQWQSNVANMAHDVQGLSKEDEATYIMLKALISEL